MICAISALIALGIAAGWTRRARRDMPILPAWTDERLRANRRIILARWPTIALSAIVTLQLVWIVDRLAGLGVFAPFERLSAIVLLVLAIGAAVIAYVAVLDRRQIDAAAKIRLHETVPPPMPEAPVVLYQAPDARHIDLPQGRRPRTIN